MPLNEDELQSLKNSIRAELEQEHQEREERARQKAERRTQKKENSRSLQSEKERLKTQMRLEFYREHGYEEKIDPTGRKMYLSPSELENKKRKKSRRSKSKKNSKQIAVFKKLGEWPMYISAAVFALVFGLMLVRAM